MIKENKRPYLKRAKKGDLIAYKVSEMKASSGKIVKKFDDKKIIKVVTEYGREDLVNYSEILWIKTGSRWPKGVYEMLKGKCSDEEERAKNN